jgi:hypothetical protein
VDDFLRPVFFNNTEHQELFETIDRNPFIFTFALRYRALVTQTVSMEISLRDKYKTILTRNVNNDFYSDYFIR